MLSSPLVSICFFALVARAQETSSLKSTSASDNGKTSLIGVSEAATPTGSYISYSTTSTVVTSSPITTSALLSTITSGSSTRTTTVGSTTIFAISDVVMTSNLTNSTSTSSSTSSQTLLQGSARMSTTAPGNSTSSSTAAFTSSSATPTNVTPCNNYPEFCSRSYGNITEVSAHNSPFVLANNAAANQAFDVITQLNDGIRLLQGQMHFVNSTPHFCHTSCDILDAGPITEYLAKVYTWVSTHPYDIITIILENGDYRPVTDYVPFLEATGLVHFAYIPPVIPMSREDWPTLASMILSGKRVVFFMDYDANQTAVPYILDEFTQVFETPFDPTDRSFPCDAQRPPDLSTADAQSRLYLTNHNLNYDIDILGASLDVPNIPLLNITNNVSGYGSLGAGTETCVQDWGYPPKFLNVDYYNVGNGSVFEVAARWNNVTYNRTCCGVATSGAPRFNSKRRRVIPALVVGLLAGLWLL
ncbi:hypothetical protein B7494_g256 [Chlorociboria aeruginascens]|nr:hypothetical protein B7494_g256 [Chlorociboria aeruginascens]